LAQFQQLDQTISTGSDVSSILTDLNGMVGTSATSSSADTSNAGANTGAGAATNS